MIDKERIALIQEITDLHDWLLLTSGYLQEDKTIAYLIENDGNVFEAFLVIHLIDGGCIELSNNCYQSFMRKKYLGDSFFYKSEKGVIDIVLRSGTPTNKAYTRLQVPLSSICYIENYNKKLNWQSLSKLTHNDSDCPAKP